MEIDADCSQSGLLELLLDLNSSPALPPHLRFDIFQAGEHSTLSSIPSVVPDNITPQQANDLLLEYTVAVQRGQLPHLDLHVLREQIEKTLAAQDVVSLEELEASVNHTIPPPDGVLPDELVGEDAPGFLKSEMEDEYLLRLDTELGNPVTVSKEKEKEKEKERDKTGFMEDKFWNELTPREIDRKIELQNPQSQHNWLRNNTTRPTVADVEDSEGFGTQDVKPPGRIGGSGGGSSSGGGGGSAAAAAPATPAASTGGKRNLAKQVGDRAVGRAREGFSPSAAFPGDEEELAFIDDHPQSTSKKRARGDVDGPYKAKSSGGKSGASVNKGKRKRTGEDTPGGSGGKKPKTNSSIE
jgi:hypothetical protein